MFLQYFLHQWKVDVAHPGDDIDTPTEPTAPTRSSAAPTADRALFEGFRDAVWVHYRKHGRDLPWRHTHDPYSILVSEFMLQQTQVARVATKYTEFLTAFPDVESLAQAPLEEVLRVWQGLGYNRRALNLKRLAEAVVAEHQGRIPRDAAALRRLPGVGPATAAAVAAFAFGDAHPFLETNIRAVYLHHFFPGRTGIGDAELMPLVEATLDHDDPRSWYYALMDYGSTLKRTLENPSRRSRHHTRQSPFEGSRRQLRARALRAVLASPGATAAHMAECTGAGLEALESVLADLVQEGFVEPRGEGYHPVR